MYTDWKDMLLVKDYEIRIRLMATLKQISWIKNIVYIFITIFVFDWINSLVLKLIECNKHISNMATSTEQKLFYHANPKQSQGFKKNPKFNTKTSFLE